jgi:hypothetical protein
LKCGFQNKVCASKSPTFFSRKPLVAIIMNEKQFYKNIFIFSLLCYTNLCAQSCDKTLFNKFWEHDTIETFFQEEFDVQTLEFIDSNSTVIYRPNSSCGLGVTLTGHYKLNEKDSEIVITFFTNQFDSINNKWRQIQFNKNYKYVIYNSGRKRLGKEYFDGIPNVSKKLLTYSNKVKYVDFNLILINNQTNIKLKYFSRKYINQRKVKRFEKELSKINKKSG